MKTLRNLALGCIIAASSFLPIKRAEAEITGSFSSSIKTHYIAMGYVLGKGPHKQDTLSINNKNLNAFVWSDYDIGNKKMSEIDIGVNATKQIDNNLSLNGGYIYMHYPQGQDDRVLSLSVNQNGILEKRLDISCFLKNKEIPTGFAFEPSISKSVNLNPSTQLSFGVSSTYLDNFYRDFGISNISLDASFSYSKGNLLFNGLIGKQFGFMESPKMLPPCKDQLYGGVELNSTF
jgi:hypothetical protein